MTMTMCSSVSHRRSTEVVSITCIARKRVTFTVLLLLTTCVTYGYSQGFGDCPKQTGGGGDPTETDQPPTPAPSMAHFCTSQTSNARGHYRTSFTPCLVTFHRSIDEPEIELIEYRTSELCTSDNGFLTMKEYVNNWPDECVGDFARCYSLEHHRSVIWDFLCEKDWHVPEGTTHISVDCTEDKAQALQSITEHEFQANQQAKQALLETYELKLFNLGLILVSCLAGLYALNKLIIKPIVELRAESLSSTLSTSGTNNSSNNNNSSSSSTNSNITTDTTFYRCSSSGSDSSTLLIQDGLTVLPMLSQHDEEPQQQQQQQLPHSPQQSQQQQQQQVLPQYHPHHVPHRRSFHQEQHQQRDQEQQQLLQPMGEVEIVTVDVDGIDFDAQEPANFDAVPLVAATILPDHD